jgi:hypothetical protein
VIERLRAAWPRYQRPVRDALILVGLVRAFVFFFVQGGQPWTFWGVDARAYWQVDLAHPYTESAVGELSNYLYSPAFAQLLAPFSNLPFEVFFALWFAVSFAILVWLVRPWPWAVPMLILPIVYELCVGNIHFLLAAAFVVVLRAPAAWAFPLLTKITPAIGGVWHLVRLEWRAVAIAVGTTAAIVAVSFALSPSAWIDWISFLSTERGQSQLLLPRLAAAGLLVMWGARTDRAWTIAIAGWLALPVVWVNSWVILLACVRLARERRWAAPEAAA